MARILTAAAAQMGPIARAESRTSCVNRMIEMMREAKPDPSLLQFTSMMETRDS